MFRAQDTTTRLMKAWLIENVWGRLFLDGLTTSWNRPVWELPRERMELKVGDDVYTVYSQPPIMMQPHPSQLVYKHRFKRKTINPYSADFFILFILTYHVA